MDFSLIFHHFQADFLLSKPSNPSQFCKFIFSLDRSQGNADNFHTYSPYWCQIQHKLSSQFPSCSLSQSVLEKGQYMLAEFLWVFTIAYPFLHSYLNAHQILNYFQLLVILFRYQASISIPRDDYLLAFKRLSFTGQTTPDIQRKAHLLNGNFTPLAWETNPASSFLKDLLPKIPSLYLN